MGRSILLAALVACWTGPASPPPAPSAHAPAAASPPRGPAIFVGRYVCAQGPTALRFTARRTCGRSASDRPRLACSIEGIFEFGPLGENPGVPHGSYRVRGTVVTNPRGELVVRVVPGAWIEQPAGYVTVGFDATSDRSHRRLRGAIANPSCGELALTRVD